MTVSGLAHEEKKDLLPKTKKNICEANSQVILIKQMGAITTEHEFDESSTNHTLHTYNIQQVLTISFYLDMKQKMETVMALPQSLVCTISCTVTRKSIHVIMCT